MRHLFLGDVASWALGVGGDETALSGAAGKHALLIPGGTVSFYTQRTGGVQYTDLKDMLGSTLSTVTADANGAFPQTQGPDTSPETWYMWADGNGGAGPRVLVTATDMGDVVNSDRDALTNLILDVATLQTAAANSLGTIVKDEIGGVWAVRPDDSRPYLWVGSTAPPVGGGYAVAGKDIWFNPVPVA